MTDSHELVRPLAPVAVPHRSPQLWRPVLDSASVAVGQGPTRTQESSEGAPVNVGNRQAYLVY